MNSYNGFTSAQRTRAQNWLRRQWKAGTIVRATVCCACGQDAGIIDAHAEDYSEPFGPHLLDFPLCYVCHMMVHCRFKNPEAWRRYREAIAGGWRFPAFTTRNFPRFCAQMLGPRFGCERVLGQPPTLLVLEEIESAA